MVLGELLYLWRKAHAKSVRQLAKIIGIDHITLHRFERGHTISNRKLSLVVCWIFGEP